MGGSVFSCPAGLPCRSLGHGLDGPQGSSQGGPCDRAELEEGVAVSR